MEDGRNGYQSNRLELSINSYIEYDYDEKIWLAKTTDLKGNISPFSLEIRTTAGDYYDCLNKLERILCNIYSLKGRCAHWVHFTKKDGKKWNILRRL